MALGKTCISHAAGASGSRGSRCGRPVDLWQDTSGAGAGVSVKQDRAEMLTSEWKTVEMKGSKEYEEAIAYLEKHAYEVSEYENGTKDYNLLQPAMEDWEYSEDPGSVLR